MPKALISMLSTPDKDREIFADFVVAPLTAYKEGYAQEVRVTSASNIVVVEGGKVIMVRRSL